MKVTKNITTLIVAGIMLFSAGCEPIEDRDLLKNSFNPDNIEIEVIQTAGGTGNGLTLKMNTPGVIGYWDYVIDKKYTDVVNNVIFPIRGTFTFKYIVSTPYINGSNPDDRDVIIKTIEVTIDELDQPLPEVYYPLVGENLEGKTWVFATSEPLWWFMSSDDGNYMGAWWNAADCCAPPDTGGKMVFDLEGGTNYTYYADAGGVATGSGSFSFSSDYTKLTIGGGVNILGGEGTGANACANSLSISSFGVYEIKELTAERLVLYIQEAGDRNSTEPEPCRSGWTWVFVPEE